MDIVCWTLRDAVSECTHRLYVVADFGQYMDKHNPEVVIFDLSPPYDENRR